MSHQDPIFNITSSYYLNEMQSVLLGRIDKFISITLFVLGGSVMLSFSSLFIVGALISILSALQFFLQFGKQSDLANERSKKYLSLLHNSDIIPKEELHRQFEELLKTDIPVFGVLYNPAFKRAAIKLDRVDDTTLTKFESVVAWLAGDLPR
ncbi:MULTISPECIES: hypothetical protein [unclassified Providencia]|uniref:hypothetical protein n=1 Tax=unclassified Providencia TaxID=2633465 RepID=UPI001C5B919E|nr:hypothetical protein [Providencia sp. R33]QXX84272.1 hypothetical protein J6836_07830 [Providencia sp. R33]